MYNLIYSFSNQILLSFYVFCFNFVVSWNVCKIDCNGCSSSPICESLLTVFDVIAASNEQDNKISIDEMCDRWFLVEAYGIDDINYNCSEFVYAYDTDGDAMFTANEAVQLFYWKVYNAGEKGFQVDCSLCSDSVEDYYGYR